jgi:hypothetical protein
MKNGTGVDAAKYRDKDMKCQIGLLDKEKNQVDWMKTNFKLKDGEEFEVSGDDGRLDDFSGRGNKYEFNRDNNQN